MIILNNMQKLCTQCFYIGVEESNIYGDFTTETFLWFPATIIFFIALLYSISGYTFKACVCSKCHSNSMIPVDSDKARQIIHERGLVPPAYIVEKDERTILGMAFRTIFFILTVALVLFMLYDHFS